MRRNGFRLGLFAAAVAVSVTSIGSLAQQPSDPPSADSAASAAEIAAFFSQVGKQIYEDCIFDLSDEQIEVQNALVDAYIKIGASAAVARRLAAQQIEPPKLSEKCKQLQGQSAHAGPNAPAAWDTTIATARKLPRPAAPKIAVDPAAPVASLASKKVLPQWDCAPGVQYVTIQHKGYDRKLTGGEICNPFEDVVHPVPASAKSFRLGYAIRTGRLFVVSSDPQSSGKTIAWATSGRDVCRNNPDPDCLAARAIGPLPPGEYTFSSDKKSRVSWGPRSKRMVAGIYLSKLWNREKFSKAQTAAILARSNIAIHVRLKGEMSEACLGLGPQGWAYVASLIQEGRATGVNVYIDEPYPKLAEAPPIISTSSFSLTSLFK
jgi:hypothetical protein